MNNIHLARTAPDDVGRPFRRDLVMFEPRELLREQALVAALAPSRWAEEVAGVAPRVGATPGMPERRAVGRHRARVANMLPAAARAAIRVRLAEPA